MLTAREILAGAIVAVLGAFATVTAAVINRKSKQTVTADAAQQISQAFNALVGQLQLERSEANREVDHLKDVCKRLEKQVSRLTRYIDALEKVLRDNGIDPPGLPPEAQDQES